MTEATKADKADKADLAPGIKEQMEADVNKQEPDPNLVFSDRHLRPGEEAVQALPDNTGPSDGPRGAGKGGAFDAEGKMGETVFSKGGQYVPEKKKAPKAEKSDK